MPATRIRGNPPSKSRRSNSLPKSTANLQSGTTLHSLTLPINEVFTVIKDQPWVRRLTPIQHDPALPEAEDYCSYHDSKGHKTAHSRSLWWYLKELVC